MDCWHPGKARVILKKFNSKFKRVKVGAQILIAFKNLNQLIPDQNNNKDYSLNIFSIK